MAITIKVREHGGQILDGKDDLWCLLGQEDEPPELDDGIESQNSRLEVIVALAWHLGVILEAISETEDGSERLGVHAPFTAIDFASLTLWDVETFFLARHEHVGVGLVVFSLHVSWELHNKRLTSLWINARAGNCLPLREGYFGGLCLDGVPNNWQMLLTLLDNVFEGDSLCLYYRCRSGDHEGSEDGLHYFQLIIY